MVRKMHRHAQRSMTAGIFTESPGKRTHSSLQFFVRLILPSFPQGSDEKVSIENKYVFGQH